jgi:hypothetical protein
MPYTKAFFQGLDNGGGGASVFELGGLYFEPIRASSTQGSIRKSNNQNPVIVL